MSPITGNKHLFYLVRCDVSRKTNISVTLLLTTKVHLFHKISPQPKMHLFLTKKISDFTGFHHFSHIKLTLFHTLPNAHKHYFLEEKLYFFHTLILHLYLVKILWKITKNCLFHSFFTCFSKNYPFHGPSQTLKSSPISQKATNSTLHFYNTIKPEQFTEPKFPYNGIFAEPENVIAVFVCAYCCG